MDDSTAVSLFEVQGSIAESEAIDQVPALLRHGALEVRDQGINFYPAIIDQNPGSQGLAVIHEGFSAGQVDIGRHRYILKPCDQGRYRRRPFPDRRRLIGGAAEKE